MAKNNGAFRTMKIIGIVAGILALLCGTVWAVADRFGSHESRLTILETHIVYIKEAVGRIEEKLNE